MFTVYVIIAGLVGVILGIVIGDIKYNAIDKIQAQVDFYFNSKEKEFKAVIENLTQDIEKTKNKEIKNISAAEIKDVNNVKSAVDNITPPKI